MYMEFKAEEFKARTKDDDDFIKAIEEFKAEF